MNIIQVFTSFNEGTDGRTERIKNMCNALQLTSFEVTSVTSTLP